MNILDTDVVVELIRNGRYEAGDISIITLIEVLRGLDPEKEGKVKELLEKSFNVLNLNNDIVRTYCRLYRGLREKGEALPDADLIIAATAMTHNVPLKSRDEHFVRLEEYGLIIA